MLAELFVSKLNLEDKRKGVMKCEAMQSKKGSLVHLNRSLLKADGLTDEELERPLIAVISSQNETHSRSYSSLIKSLMQ